MKEKEMIQLAWAGVQAFNMGTTAVLAFRAHLAPDAVYEEIGTGQRIQGVDQILAYLLAWKQASPNGTGRITHALASGDTAVIEITWEGHLTDPLQTPRGTIPQSCQRVVTRAVQVIRFEGNKVKELRQYVDAMSLLHQIGGLTAVAEQVATPV